jgi:transcriptional regulator
MKHRREAFTAVDRRLSEMCQRAQPGRRYTQREIALACGCSPGWVGTVERRALIKIEIAREKRSA